MDTVTRNRKAQLIKNRRAVPIPLTRVPGAFYVVEKVSTSAQGKESMPSELPRTREYASPLE